jgi:16S rRNA (guanine966-N2)-methyltransferase
MRIIAGQWGGRRLFSPGPQVRPTQDRVRQILFDILGRTVEEGAILDLYAGSGALGLEALSRGAPRAVFVESHRRTCAVLERNCAVLGAQSVSRILGMTAHAALALLHREQARFRWIVADPPYFEADRTALLSVLGEEAGALLAPGGGLALEASSREKIPDGVGGLRRVRLRVVGETSLHLFAQAGTPAEVPAKREGAEG